MVGKRRPTLSDEMMRDVWNVRDRSFEAAELVHFEKLVSSAVARCLREDSRSREVRASGLSQLVGETVSVAMLDSYTSEARREHKVPASRFLVLIAMTRRFDILDAVLRDIGGKALDRHEAKVFHMGVDYAAALDAERTLHHTVSELFPPTQLEARRSQPMTTDGTYQEGYIQGYKAVAGNNVVVPVAPVPPVTPVGKTPYQMGLLAGMEAAQR